MICAKWKNDSIPFLTVWFKGGLANFRCPQCGVLNRVRKAALLAAISVSLGSLDIILGLVFRSWWVFGVALAASLLLDGFFDLRLAQLEIAEECKNSESSWQRAILISILSGAIGFGLLIVFAEVLWLAVPYPEHASRKDIRLVWSIHIIAEKIFSWFITAVCAIGAAVSLRQTWRTGFGAAIGAGLVYQAIAIIIYVARFGLSAYLNGNRFWLTIATTILISALFGLAIVWSSYRREQQERMAKPVKATNGLSRAES